jgi:16S rRNA G527 N7-methylase RsmG
MNPTKYLSCGKQVSRLEKILHSLATRVARIVLQRAEETFPSVRERVVFRACVHRQEFYFYMSVVLAKETIYFVTRFCLFA